MATRSPASALHLEREMANKLFIQPPKSSIKPQTRNPITQDDIEFKESSSHKMAPVIYTASKTQGIAMGEFAAKSKRSDIFGDPLSSSKASRKFIPHSSSETYIPTVSLKKSEYQPPSRNPITQDSIETYNPAVRTKISESTAFSHLFDGQQEVQRPRDNIYYEHMKRNVFENEEFEQKRLAKSCSTYAPEIGDVMKHKTAEISVSNDPTKNRIKQQDLMQKKILEGNAKIYSARRNESNITF